MKKIFLAITVMICVITTAFMTCYAADVAIINAMENEISVTGTAQKGTYVSLTVLNPGYTEADFAVNPAAAIAYFGGQLVGGANQCGHTGNYCFHVKLAGDGGNFTIIVNADENKETLVLPFYQSSVKFDMIDEVNTAEDEDELLLPYGEGSSATVLDEVYEKFSLSTSPLYTDGKKADIAKALITLRNDIDGKEFGDQTGDDLDTIYTILKQAALIGAYNGGNSKVVAPDGELLYLEDIMALTGTDELSDYADCINADGMDGIMKDLFKKTYKTVGEIEEEFKNQVRFRVLVDYSQRGYGHIEEYFEKYGEYYEEIGFDFDKFESKSGKNTIYSAIASSKASDIERLKKEFNELLKDSKKPSGGGGGGGSVPNNTPVVTPEAEPTPQEPVEPAEPQAPASSFSDVSGHWAESDIEALAKAGVINGKGDGSFAPDGTVSRGELAKIVVMGISGGIDETAVISFADAKGHWAESYIATAAKLSVVSGTSADTFNPDGLITREQAAAIIYRAMLAKGMELKGSDKKFSDDASISDWAKEAVYALKALNIISGRGDGTFCPADSLTRAEAAKLVNTVLNLK